MKINWRKNFDEGDKNAGYIRTSYSIIKIV